MRTVFSLIPINTMFMFVGSECIWKKTSDFSIELFDSPMPVYDEVITASVIKGQFKTDSMIDVYKD